MISLHLPLGSLAQVQMHMPTNGREKAAHVITLPPCVQRRYCTGNHLYETLFTRSKDFLKEINVFIRQLINI